MSSFCLIRQGEHATIVPVYARTDFDNTVHVKRVTLLAILTCQASLLCGLLVLLFLALPLPTAVIALLVLLLAVIPFFYTDLQRLRENRDGLSALQMELERRSCAVESALDGIAILDQDERYIFVNEAHARAYGYASAKELLGRSWRILYSPQELIRFEREYMPRLWRQGSLRIQATGRRKDGSEFAQDLSLSRLRGGGLVCVVRDISELRQAQEQLIQSQKMEAVGQLAGGVAHDFNNLITSILGYTSFLRSEHTRDPSVVKAAEMIERIAHMAAQLTQKLLTFARRTPSQNIPINVHRAIEDAAAIFSRVLPAHINLRLDLVTPRAAIRGDPLQLQQVILNLALNARDAMNPQLGGTDGGDLVLGTREVTIAEGEKLSTLLPGGRLPPGHYLQLFVQDSGCGIAPEIHSKIFEPFFTTKEPGKGTGMGLSVVYGIVNSHRGAVALKSTVGKGTTFEVYFPLLEEEAAEDAAPQEHAQRAAAG
jgi:two-component system, cell cycle sensor histidine kinase and response regulator CckA